MFILMICRKHILSRTCQINFWKQGGSHEKRKTPDLEKYLEGKKRRFVNYTQGAKIYRMSYWPFVRLAKKAEANYPIRKTAIVDLNILDDFLEGNPEVVSELKKRRGKRYGK